MENNINDTDINLENSMIDRTETENFAKRKISIRQLMILFFFTTVSGIMRATVNLTDTSQTASKAVWLTPLAALLPVLLLIFILNEVTKKHREKSLAQIIEMVLGKILGKIVLFAFFTHIIFYISFYVRNFAEKFIASIFSEISPSFFMIVLILIAVFAARRNIEAFARFSEIAFILLIAVFVIAFFISIFSINPKNIYPVTSYDIMPVLKSSVPIISLLSLLTFALFLGDSVTQPKSNPDIFKQTAAKFVLFLTLFNLVGTLIIVGIFNAETIQHMSMPYFMMFKTIKTTGLIQGLETFFILFWVCTDFILITYYLFVLSKVSGKLFELDKSELFIAPLVFIILILAHFIGVNEVEAEYFYSNIINYSSIVLGLGLPVVILIAGKARKIL